MTLELAVLAFLIANLIAVPLGVIAAASHLRRWTRPLSRCWRRSLGAIPNFWLATLLMLVFAIQLRWLPAGRLSPRW